MNIQAREPVIGAGPHRPASATHGAVASVGLAAFLAALVLLLFLPSFPGGIAGAALLVIGLTAGAIFLVDIAWTKVHLRPSTGLDFTHDDPSWSRTGCKLLGLAGSLGFLALLYWLAPEYHGDFYDRFYAMLAIAMPVWIVLAPPYFYLVDRRMREPHDGYWHLGSALMLRLEEVDRAVLTQHILGWLVKGFFLPLMFVYFCNDLERLFARDVGELVSFDLWYDFLFGLFFLVDVGLASMGYLMSLRLTDTHLRSADPTMLGWVAALVCYEPFVSLLSRQYLQYETGLEWGAWLWDTPLAYVLWGSGILILTAIYVWATVMFGARFSNLTHRGIITNGPYRWTRHPAYIAKNLSWWMISIPFISQGTPGEALRHCLLLLGLNAIYLVRAKTEERHLAYDPVYREYSLYIMQHGMFRHMRRIPYLRALA